MPPLQQDQSKTLNRILRALSPEEYACIAPHLEPAVMARCEVLYRPDEPVTHVYFPQRGTVSVVSGFEDGARVEVGMVGNEGLVGLNALLGSVSAPLEAVVQLPGDALRVRTDLLKKQFKKCGSLHDFVLRYAQAFIIQIAQAAACNQSHKLEGRVARWLLMCQDRSQTGELEVTHEFISAMLGVRRAGVTEAVGALSDAGLIKHTRAHISITDRAGLEAASCECYDVVRREFDLLLGGNGHRL